MKSADGDIFTFSTFCNFVCYFIYIIVKANLCLRFLSHRNTTAVYIVSLVSTSMLLYVHRDHEDC